MYTYTHNFHEFPNLFPSKPLSSDISQPMTRFSFRILQATTLRWVPVRREVNGDMRWVCLRFWKLQWLQLSLATWSELGESNLLRSFRTLNKNLGIYRSYFFFFCDEKKYLNTFFWIYCCLFFVPWFQDIFLFSDRLGLGQPPIFHCDFTYSNSWRIFHPLTPMTPMTGLSFKHQKKATGTDMNHGWLVRDW